MFELHVYYHNILRYTLIANWGKVQELQEQGYYVKVRPLLMQ